MQGMFYIGDALVDPAARQISRGDVRRRLSPKAMAVLMALVAAEGRVLNRAALLDAAWPEVTVGEEVLTHAIAEIRRALGDDSRAPRFVETVHKSGYRLLTVPRSTGALQTAVSEIDPFAVVDGGAPLGDWRAAAPAIPANDEIFDLQDYALYLRACDLFGRGGRRNLHAAASLFYRLVEARPQFAAGYSGLARTLVFVDLYFGPAEDCLAKALDLSEAAVRIDPRASDSHAARGLALAQSGDIPGANRSFVTAIGLRPDSAETHLLLGHAAFTWGDEALSAAMLERAAHLQGEDFHSLVLAAKVRHCLGDEDGARADAAKALTRIDAHLRAHPGDFRALCGKARVLVEMGRPDEGIELVQPLLRQDDSMNYYLACMLARAGEVPLALDLLEEIVDTGWRNTELMRRDNDFAPLRREARFRRLAAAA